MTKDPREVFKREAEKKLSKNGFVGFSKKGEGTTRIMGSTYKVKTESTDKIFMVVKSIAGKRFQVE